MRAATHRTDTGYQFQVAIGRFDSDCSRHRDCPITFQAKGLITSQLVFLEQRNESYRQASISAGLDETAISRYFRGTQPVRDACIALADYFGINPNEMLEAAGYKPLHFFDRRMIDPSAFPPDIDQLAGEIMQIENKDIRREMVKTLRQVLRIQMQMREDAIQRILQQAEATVAQSGKAFSK